MSDIYRTKPHIRRVNLNTSQADKMITAANEAKNWLEALTEVEHRGRYDTWGAARDRAANKAGIKRTYAKHLWDRWQTMKDVSGEAYRSLKAAYEAQCAHNEKMAALHKQRAEEIRNGGASHQDSSAATDSMARVAVRKAKARAD